MQINQVGRQGNRSQFTIHNLELITNRELQIVNYELVMSVHSGEHGRDDDAGPVRQKTEIPIL